MRKIAHGRDRAAIVQVRIGPSGELLWSDQVDLCPNALSRCSSTTTIRRISMGICDSVTLIDNRGRRSARG
jgi:hypothetical protein